MSRKYSALKWLPDEDAERDFINPRGRSSGKKKDKEEQVTWYWAYGSNLNVRSMQRRCPSARKFGKLIVDDCQLIFRGVADVIYKSGSSVQGGLWRITSRCEAALDGYEGFPHFYGKKYLKIRTKSDGKEHRVLYYYMKRGGIMPPSTYYLDTIAQGYKDFGLDLNCLDEAVRRSWTDKDATQELKDRHVRRGGKLAQRDHIFEVDGIEDGIVINDGRDREELEDEQS